MNMLKSLSSNFHIVDNDLKFTNTWELPHLPKAALSYLEMSVEFINGSKFKNRPMSESWQISHSFTVCVCVIPKYYSFGFIRVRVLQSVYLSKDYFLDIEKQVDWSHHQVI